MGIVGIPLSNYVLTAFGMSLLEDFLYLSILNVLETLQFFETPRDLHPLRSECIRSLCLYGTETPVP